MCIVAQRDNALHDFVDDDNFEYISSIPFKRYRHESLAPHRFLLTVISMNGLKTVEKTKEIEVNM